MYYAKGGIYINNRGALYVIPKTSSIEQFKNDSILFFPIFPYGHQAINFNVNSISYTEPANYHIDEIDAPTNLDIEIKSELFLNRSSSKREYIELIQNTNRNLKKVYDYFFTRLYGHIKLGQDNINIPIDFKIGKHIISFSKNKVYKSFEEYQKDMHKVSLNLIKNVFNTTIPTDNKYNFIEQDITEFNRTFLRGSHGISGFFGRSNLTYELPSFTTFYYNVQSVTFSLKKENPTNYFNIWLYILRVERTFGYPVINVALDESGLYFTPSYPDGLKFNNVDNNITLITSILVELNSNILNKPINEKLTLVVMVDNV